MARPKKTPDNPYGLTYKQNLVIDVASENVKNGGKLDLIGATRKIYNTHHPKGPANIANENVKHLDFRQALIASLQKKRVLGVNGKVEQRLVEGLDAETSTPTGRTMVDFKARLAYVQELNKIAGIYAPDRKQTQTLHLNVNMSEDEANQKIQRYLEQVGE